MRLSGVHIWYVSASFGVGPHRLMFVFVCRPSKADATSGVYVSTTDRGILRVPIIREELGA